MRPPAARMLFNSSAMRPTAFSTLRSEETSLCMKPNSLASRSRAGGLRRTEEEPQSTGWPAARSRSFRQTGSPASRTTAASMRCRRTSRQRPCTNTSVRWWVVE